jgi:hypothetical protein
MQSLDRRCGYVRAGIVLVIALATLAAGLSATLAQAASWHLDTAFGKRGVAGLPVREGGFEHFYTPGPGDQGALLASGPKGSVFVGGFAHSKPGAFLLARMSAQGKLVTGFGHGGLITVPAIYARPEHPPRMFALGGGGLLVVGLNRTHQLAVVRLSANGQPDRAFGHAGVAQYVLASTHGHAIVAGASLEAGGHILIGYFRSEVPQPSNEPAITYGLGAGPLGLVRLLPSGGLDPSFGSAGFLTAGGPPPETGEGVACDVTIANSGSVLLAYEQAFLPGGKGSESPAVQELGPTGADAPGFGDAGIAYLASTPVVEGVDSIVCGGLFALANGEVEASFGGGGELFRFTSAGLPNPAFGSSGHTSSSRRVVDMALGANGETFALVSIDPLVVIGTLASGTPDPRLGGKAGMHFPVKLARSPRGEEHPVVELLPVNGGLDLLVGESLVRVED